MVPLFAIDLFSSRRLLLNLRSGLRARSVVKRGLSSDRKDGVMGNRCRWVELGLGAFSEKDRSLEKKKEEAPLPFDV